MKVYKAIFFYRNIKKNKQFNNMMLIYEFPYFEFQKNFCIFTLNFQTILINGIIILQRIKYNKFMQYQINSSN